MSCDVFEEHPIFGFAKCRACGVAKVSHFTARSLADAAVGAGGRSSSPASAAGPGGLGFTLPLVLRREGWLNVRKKAQRFGEWKKRCEQSPQRCSFKSLL